MSETSSIQDSGLTAITAQAAPEGLAISAPPHARGRTTVTRIMLWVLIALMPAAGVAVMLNGLYALYTILLSIAAASAAEWTILYFIRKKRAISDGSAAVTGLLVALSLPPLMPLWMAPAGSLFAIALVKMAFGGCGRNFLNPAMAGRAFLAVSFPVLFSAGAASSGGGLALPAGAHEINNALLNFCMGYQSGWMGGASACALIAGAILLWSLRIIDFVLPISFIGAAFLLFWVTGENHAVISGTAPLAALFQVLGSGVLFGAFFLATDPVTSPSTAKARLLFGAGCGVLMVLFQKTGLPDGGMMSAILLMNFTVPYMDRYLVHRVFSAQRGKTVEAKPVAGPQNKGPFSDPLSVNTEPVKDCAVQ